MSIETKAQLARLAREIWGDQAALELCEQYGLSPDVLKEPFSLPMEDPGIRWTDKEPA